MDRVSRLRTEAGSASDDSGANDTGFQTADDTASGSTKYLSFSEGDSCTPKKGGGVALGESTPRTAAVDAGFGAGLSPIAQSGDDIVYGIGGQIDASNILSGGVDIFDDYNSNDGDGLVIDDDAANVSEDAESGADDKTSRGTEKVICEPIESANLSLSADATLTLKEISESQLVEAEGAREECRTRADEPAGNNEVILQIDGKNVDALDIGNGLYLYRKVEGEELNAIQILQEEGQSPHFKFLKVRQIGDSNLEVYEEHILEVPITNEELEEEKRKEKIEGIHGLPKKSPHLPISDVKKAFVHENPASGKTVALNTKSLPKEDQALKLAASVETKLNSDSNDEKSEGNPDSKLKPLKNLEGSRKSPILGNFTSMTLHSSPNREGAPPTKTKINLPLNSSRHSDTVKKTIEVSTDNSNLKCNEKTIISNALPPKIDVTCAPTHAPQLSDETKGVVKELLFKSDDATGKSASHIKFKDDKPVFDNHNDKSFAQFEDTNKMQSSVKTSEHDIVNNSDGILSPKKKTDGQSNIGSSDDTILAESKKTTDNKSNIAGKPIDMKKDVQTNKPNVVSKWVLRSDSIEEKCKKERDKMPVEIKPVSTFNTKVPSNDISVKNSPKDVEIKHTNIEMPNTGISKDKTKEECKEVKEKVCKPTPEIKTQQENNASQYVLGETSKTIPNLKVTEEDKKSQKVSDQKHADSQSITKGTTSGGVDEKNCKTEKANNSEFVSKYISEAFKNIPTRPMAMASSTENTKNKLEFDGKFKTKPVEKLPTPVTAKTTNYDAPLRIDVETVSKPVPFGKWTEGDKQEYLNKLKDQKLPSTNPGLSPAKSYQLASTKNDIKRLELKKKADTFERVHLSTVLTAGLPDKPDEKNDDVHMKGLIDKTIEGMIMETLLGSAAKPPVMNPPSRSLPATEDTDSEDSYEDLERKMNELHGIPLKEKHAPSLYSSVKGTLGTIGSTSKGNEKSIPRAETNLSHSKTPSLNKGVKMPKLLPLSSSGNNKIETNIAKSLPKSVNAAKVIDEEDSDEEIIDCEPVTGDMQWPSQDTKDSQKVTVAAVQKMVAASASKVKDNVSSQKAADKKPGITEIEFDKFVRRNSTNQNTSNNNMTSEVESKKVHLTTQALFESDIKYKKIKSLNQQIPERTLSTSMNLKTSQPSLGATRSLTSHIPQSLYPSKSAIRDSGDPLNLYSVQSDGASNINYHTKLQMAYQSALSAKNQKEPTIKILEDKPLKTAFLSSNAELIPTAQNLSTVKRSIQSTNYVESINATVSQVISSNDEVKPSDQTIVKSKHQRKQVLTPVESPPIEIVEPSDHIDDFGHKKRRKLEPKAQRSESGLHNNVTNKDFKNMAPKKNYLLGRASSVAEETKKDEVNAITNKTLSEVSSDEKTTNKLEESVVEVPITPKRGRGRPRKYPIQDASEVPHKNITPKTSKSSESDSQDQHSSIASVDTEDNDSDEEGIIRENWTMGKIDEKIVCPICNKLFRSENIVFKHVKHCSSLLKSPSKRSSTTFDMGSSPKKGKTEISIAEDPSNAEPIKNQPIYAEPAKHVPDSKDTTDSQNLSDVKSNSVVLIDSPTTAQNVIVIEDSPAPTVDIFIKEKEVMGKTKQTSSIDTKKSEPAPSRPKVNKVGRPRCTTQHTCEICGKTFRQLSYLAHHRSLHNKELPKPQTSDKPVVENKAMLSCEVCGKDFRKLHHLVEHREIHTTNTAAATAPQRKVSIEQKKDADASPKSSPIKTDDHPAGFRCEPCDKSFRKLHHLVEHRETHDGVNRQKNTPSQPATAEKPTADSPTCEVCGKSFRKLHHLIEHREQHTEAHQVEKKEKKSTLLAKDIIHECSLCYMVFPNEPSLNKHFGNCQKKKKTPASGLSTEEPQTEEESEAALAVEVVLSEPEEVAPQTEPEAPAASSPPAPSPPPVPLPAHTPVVTKRNSKEFVQTDVPAVPEKINKSESEIPKTPKNKTPKPAKIGGTVTKVSKMGVTVKKPAKIGATVTKRSRPSYVPLPEVGDNLEVNWKDSDDDSRYMINPSYKPESDEEREIFLNICVGKRSSLQFESPSAKAEFKRRRTSLQHPAKSQRLIPKNVEKLSKPPNVPSEENPTATQKAKPIKLQNKRSSSAVPSNSSLGEDNDVKYSFPKNAKTQKFQSKSGIPAPKNQTTKRVSEERSVRKTETRKSLTGIAKRKSLGKNVAMKPKSNINKAGPTTIPAAPKKDVKNQARHVCDCGAPFSSVTLLAQHTSVAHTPPRIRRSRLTDPPAPPPASRNKHKLIKHSGVPVAINKMRDIDK